MTTDRDTTTRVVRSWLKTEEHESAERLLDAVLDQIDTTPQRRAGWPAWRTPTMTRFVTIALGAAAVLVALIVGAQILGSPNGGVGTAPTPTATPEPTPEPTPSPSADAGLPEGPFVLLDGVEDNHPPITVTISAPGWFGEDAGGVLAKNDNVDPPDGAGMITFVVDDGYYVYGDPCQWSTTRPDTPATTVDELVAALSAQASRDASTPVDITLDGYAGQAITLNIPDDANFAECDQGQFGSWGLGTEDPGPYRYHQGPGQIDTLWIVDVDGHLAVFDAAHYAGTPQVDIDELQAIVESATFGDTP